jgi:hypothetical protein
MRKLIISTVALASILAATTIANAGCVTGPFGTVCSPQICVSTPFGTVCN